MLLKEIDCAMHTHASQLTGEALNNVLSEEFLLSVVFVLSTVL